MTGVCLDKLGYALFGGPEGGLDGHHMRAASEGVGGQTVESAGRAKWLGATLHVIDAARGMISIARLSPARLGRHRVTSSSTPFELVHKLNPVSAELCYSLPLPSL